MEHLESLVAAADVALSGVLDRIDEIASPGMTLDPADAGWVSRVLEAARRGRGSCTRSSS
jgi:hypothetical protein